MFPYIKWTAIFKCFQLWKESQIHITWYVFFDFDPLGA